MGVKSDSEFLDSWYALPMNFINGCPIQSLWSAFQLCKQNNLLQARVLYAHNMHRLKSLL